jgi:predicted cupin superfamily sugar epimerase
MDTAESVIRMLDLQPHPFEGGYFRETHRDDHGTAIYYLLTGPGVSEMHKLPGAEVYHFYSGDPLETLLLKPDGSSEVVIVGADVAAGQRPQLVIPGGVWQGSTRIAGPHGYSLIGATMAPGFAYADYVRGGREELCRAWPGVADAIAERTPNG